MARMTFGERLRELRKERDGMTQTRLATAANIPLGTLQAYEQGVRIPLADAFHRILDALAVDQKAFAGCSYEVRKKPKQSRR